MTPMWRRFVLEDILKRKIFVQFVDSEEREIKVPKRLKNASDKDLLEYIVLDRGCDLDGKMVLWVDLLNKNRESVASWDSGINFS
jgi:hypothetical protein